MIDFQKIKMMIKKLAECKLYMYLSCYYLKVSVCEGPGGVVVNAVLKGVVQDPKVGERGEEVGEGVPSETRVCYVQPLH